MDKQNLRILTGVLVFVALVLASAFWPRGPVEVDSGYRTIMGTFARVVVVAANRKNAQKCIESAFDELKKVDELMSDYKSDSEISRVNRDGFKQPVRVSKPTFEVIQKSVKFSSLSSGAFDITVGPLMDLWRSAEEANSIPTKEQLNQAHSKVGFEKLVLDANQISVGFKVAGMRLDLGGVAKGYAIDKAVEAMQQRGATGGIVDVGGDIRCFGKPHKTDNWLIGLQDPSEKSEIRNPKFEIFFDEGRSLLTLKLNDTAVATSGGYRRFAVINGRRFSHIIDSKTGYGSDKLASVTIIAENAIDADALATAVSVLGTEKGLALIEMIPQTEAILITTQNKITKTGGAEKFIKQK